jgi:leucyl-tRNA synthetase
MGTILTLLPKPSTIQNEIFPEAPASVPALTAAREYVKVTSSNITSAEAAQQKKKDKGKNVAFDPKKPKRLTIFAASKYPAWQDKYIDLVREAFDAVSLTVNEKDLAPRVAKMGEMKKAMPFVQGLKRRLLNKEPPETVFNRKLAFDEVETLKDMVAGLKKTTGCSSVEIVVVNEGGKSGTLVNGEGGKVEGLPPSAEAAVPGTPTFHFENIVVGEFGKS